MIGELIINGEDAYQKWGVCMGSGFLESIMLPTGIKGVIENESQLEHGKRVIIPDPKLTSREVTLSFHIEGESQDDYLAKYQSFVAELQKGIIHISIPVIGPSIYKLVYQKANSFGQNSNRTFSILTVKMEEYNPSVAGRA